ncbi:Acetyl esterase/lipase [Sphingomonas sp. NFR04]|uniref:alpha/beta hydrolase n=1 Tax=Sphingomonas sp. NFR04 TaxID=1566283 RepID=UPI0008EE3F1C|nr:alpha/beta hydrolase [Sphingomonas sp. NFR04]SFJ09161.1 Acetyl esterase/lipase [Sphingomonas sp. NFR04]
MDEQPFGVRVPARVLPAPRSISADARAALDRLVDPDGMPVNAKHPMPAPEDREAWVLIKTAVDAHYAASIKGLAGTLRASVETVQVGDTVVHVATPETNTATGGAYLDLHGGALVFGGGEACRVGAQMQADLHGVRCYGVDYRTPPEHPYPAALDDTLAAYVHVLERHAPSSVFVGGRSAGGNLAVAMLLRARDQGLPMPAGMVLLSPEVDLTESGDSFEVNRLVDLMLPLPLRSANLLYADGADLSDPDLSPLFGDLTGLPPTLLQSGTRDLFLSNTVRMHRALRRAGVPAELHVFEAMPHGGFLGGTPEDLELSGELARFVRTCLRGG